jgi:hypothetical protein
MRENRERCLKIMEFHLQDLCLNWKHGLISIWVFANRNKSYRSTRTIFCTVFGFTGQVYETLGGPAMKRSPNIGKRMSILGCYVGGDTGNR